MATPVTNTPLDSFEILRTGAIIQAYKPPLHGNRVKSRYALVLYANLDLVVTCDITSRTPHDGHLAKNVRYPSPYKRYAAFKVQYVNITAPRLPFISYCVPWRLHTFLQTQSVDLTYISSASSDLTLKVLNAVQRCFLPPRQTTSAPNGPFQPVEWPVPDQEVSRCLPSFDPTLAKVALVGYQLKRQNGHRLYAGLALDNSGDFVGQQGSRYSLTPHLFHCRSCLGKEPTGSFNCQHPAFFIYWQDQPQ